MIFTPIQIKKHDVTSSKDGITWKPCRPINYTAESWRFRLKNAWRVLIGRYDVLDWEDSK